MKPNPEPVSPNCTVLGAVWDLEGVVFSVYHSGGLGARVSAEGLD